MSVVTIYNKRKLDIENYVNTLTGETLYSEFSNTTAITLKDENVAIISSEEYIIIDSKALRYIQEIFSPVDLARIQRLSGMVNGRYNLLYDRKGTALIPSTLRAILKYDEGEFSKFMKRLFEKSVINYIVGFKNGKKCKWIMLNPTLARKGKAFHKDCLNVFDDLSKKQGCGMEIKNI